VLKRYDDDAQPREDESLVDYCATNCLHRFDQALLGVIRNFPLRWAAWLMAALVFPFGTRRAPATDKHGAQLVRAALQPGAFRDRLTRDIFISDDPNDRLGLLDYTLAKAVASEAAEKKLERAIRKGEVRRFHDRDWIADAEAKGVLDAAEARSLAELRDLVARVIAVDDFSAAELARDQSQPARQAEAIPSPKPEHIAAE
jgi:acyl-CoA dehydrogenase